MPEPTVTKNFRGHLRDRHLRLGKILLFVYVSCPPESGKLLTPCIPSTFDICVWVLSTVSTANTAQAHCVKRHLFVCLLGP